MGSVECVRFEVGLVALRAGLRINEELIVVLGICLQ
jgi:hypothetical protein